MESRGKEIKSCAILSTIRMKNKPTNLLGNDLSFPEGRELTKAHYTMRDENRGNNTLTALMFYISE